MFSDHIAKWMFLSVDSCSLVIKLQPVFGLHNVQSVDATNDRLGSFNSISIGGRLHTVREMAF